MATTEELAAITTDRTQKFFDDLEMQRTVLSSCSQLFNTLTSRFASLKKSLSEKSQSLDSKFRSLESDARETLESLSRREESIPERESSAAAKIEEQKENALSEFEKPPKLENLSDSLASYSRRMDSSGLFRCLVSKRKESVVLRTEVSIAVVEAVDPPRLVLDAVEEFLRDKREKIGVTDRRWACGMLISALFSEDSSFGGNEPEFSSSVVERAAAILDRWKEEEEEPVGRGEEGSSSCGLLGPAEAVMFLRLVVGFGLKSRFDEEFLKKLVVEHAARRDMVKIAASAGFGEKMADIIDELVNGGKEIEAVYFACASGFTERFPPVPLLKSYLKNSKKNATTILKDGKHSAPATEQSNTMELNFIKAIIKCVEDNKLESEFSLDNLRNRATQLEKMKADRKKSSTNTAAKSHGKRGHGSSGGRSSGLPVFRPAKAAKFTNTYASFGRRNPAPPTQHSPATRYSGPYSYPSQDLYEGLSATPYASSYGISHVHSPHAIPQQRYTAPIDNMSAAGFRGSGSYVGQTNYGAYDYSSGAPPGYQPSS